MMAGKFGFQAAFWGIAAAAVLSGCGFKGDLYLPEENDSASFGAIQTGIGMMPPGTLPEKNQQEMQEEK